MSPRDETVASSFEAPGFATRVIHRQNTHFLQESCINSAFSIRHKRQASVAHTNSVQSPATMAKSSDTWVVTGASRGIGLQYVIQVRCAAQTDLQRLNLFIARDQCNNRGVSKIAGEIIRLSIPVFDRSSSTAVIGVILRQPQDLHE